ncbi:PspC domain-containing protein [Actinomadura flavalba]|uniref:PspC domain-containing protein n=1 Tax=Actinomadura flavalba TaxID=1120938 RepID=UPI000381F8AD|nr:PspC domain-containing protein [Actinomadura flavalba]
MVETTTDYRRLARAPEGRILAGVCTGLGRSTGIDPVVYRVGFALLVFAGGQGIMLYLAAALLMPSSPATSSPAEQVFRRWFDAAAVLSVLGALLGVGVLLSLLGNGFSTDAVAALTVFGLALLTVHGRGVDLVAAARSFPERLQGHRPPDVQEPPASTPVTFDKPASAGGPGGLPDGMIDLARYSGGGATAAGAAPSAGASAPVKAKEDCGRKGWPALTSVTVLAAAGAGALALPFADDRSDLRLWLIVGAVGLAVVGIGTLFGGWFRAGGLATTGSLLVLTLLAGSLVLSLPEGTRYGDVDWRPVSTVRTHEVYRVAIGKGRLDLTALPVRAGERVSVDAQVMVGELELTVPRGARVRLHARLTVGDLRVGDRTVNGPKIRHTEILEADGAPANPPVIDLNVRTRLGDVEVSRA